MYTSQGSISKSSHPPNLQASQSERATRSIKHRQAFLLKIVQPVTAAELQISRTEQQTSSDKLGEIITSFAWAATVLCHIATSKSLSHAFAASLGLNVSHEYGQKQ